MQILNTPAPLLGKQGVLFSLTSANMNSTADQALSPSFGFSVFVIDKIVVTNASTSLTLAVGGIYGAAAKSAPIIVAAAQVYTALTTAAAVLNPTLAAAGLQRNTAATLYLSLTTAQGSAATADVYVIGTALA